jgi:hypothetical protein
VTDAHQILTWAVVAITVALVAAAVWSTLAGRRSAGARDHRFAVDRLVLAVLLGLAANVAVGLALVGEGRRPADALHLLYGAASLATLPLGWLLGSRPSRDGVRSRARRDAWLLLTSVILLGIELRLVMTG